MEKINMANWNCLFEKAEQQVVYHSERYHDLRFQFEEPGLASGYMQAISTQGMQLSEFFLEADHPLQLIDEEPKEATESVFLLEGHAKSEFHNISSPVHIKKGEHNIQYNNQFCGSHTIASPAFHALTISYDHSFLKGMLQSDDTSSLGRLANSLYGGKTFLANNNALPCRNRINEIITTIRQCRFTGLTRYLFLESKMLELFVLQMEQVEDAANSKHDEFLTSADRERFRAVNNYIENTYLEEFTLKDLTYKFGLNEFKLKKGYKNLYQTTVFGHVLQLRMQKARELLQQKTMNVSETAFFIGYNNVSSFCTEFKKRFGYSPGNYFTTKNI